MKIPNLVFMQRKQIFPFATSSLRLLSSGKASSSARLRTDLIWVTSSKESSKVCKAATQWSEWTNSEWREACIWGALMLYWVAVGEVEGEVGREVVVDESVEFDRWLGLDDFEDEEEPTEIF